MRESAPHVAMQKAHGTHHTGTPCPGARRTRAPATTQAVRRATDTCNFLRRKSRMEAWGAGKGNQWAKRAPVMVLPRQPRGAVWTPVLAVAAQRKAQQPVWWGHQRVLGKRQGAAHQGRHVGVAVVARAPGRVPESITARLAWMDCSDRPAWMDRSDCPARAAQVPPPLNLLTS